MRQTWCLCNIIPSALLAAQIGAVLHNNPVGLCAWIVEKFHEWSDFDSDEEFEAMFEFDDLLDNVMLVLLSGLA